MKDINRFKKNQTNCPNCGAPIQSEICPYCGTVFIDFSCIDLRKPFYLKIKTEGQILRMKAANTNTSITTAYHKLPTISMEFVALDTMQIIKQETDSE